MGQGCTTEGGFCVWGRKDEEGDAKQRLFDDISVICSIPCFAFLDEKDLTTLTEAFCQQFYEVGDVVVRQGEPLSYFCVVKRGRAVLKSAALPGEPEQVTELRMGDVFGEEALLGCWPSKVTVEALDDLEVWALHGQEFDDLGLRSRLHFRRRPAVSEGKGPSVSVDPRLFEKTDQEHAELLKTLKANHILRPFLERMDSKDLEAIVDNAYLYPVSQGDHPVALGSSSPGLFFMIAEGTFDVLACGRQVQQLGPGESFGESGLLHSAYQVVAVRAATSGTLWAVPRQRFREVSRRRLHTRLSALAELLGGAGLLSGLTLEERQQLADVLVEERLQQGTCRMRQGEESVEMLVLYEGEVAVDMNGLEMTRLAADPEAGRAEFFGERALVGSSRRVASVRVVSPTATVLSLSRTAYDRVRAGGKAELPTDGLAGENEEQVEYSLEQLEELGLLGLGAFSSVALVRHTETKRVFALKAMPKGLLMEADLTQAVFSEKAAMQAARSPFLIGLAATFSSNDHIYFLMEAATGGDLYALYRRRCLFGSKQHARFYAACVLRALESLHARYVIHRDVKPENLLLDERGYCKLGDFGMATSTTGYTYTLCGTPEYMAPEVVAGSGHCRAVDWWALGVLVIELMTGDSPFAAEEPCTVYRKVLSGINTAEITARQAVLERQESPDEQPGEGAREEAGIWREAGTWSRLAMQLCMLEPCERLAMQPGGAANVAAHMWFAADEFDWHMHTAGKMEAPFVPKEEELGPEGGGFDALEQEGPRRPAYEDPGTGWDSGFECRRGRVFN